MKKPPDAEVHCRIELFEAPSVILFLLKEHSILEEEPKKDKFTVPVNPLRLTRLIVELPTAPAFTVTAVGLAERVKSWIMKVTIAKWDSPLLEPVIVTLYLLGAEPLQDKVEAPEVPRVMLRGEREQVRPVGVEGEMENERLTVPANPKRLVTLIEETPTTPAFRVTNAGFAAIAKSWTAKVKLTERERVPEAVTVTL